MVKKKEEWTREQKLELLKGLGKGVIELAKSSKVISYGLSSLTILALGKAKILPCHIAGTLQAVTTYLAISDVIDEGGGSVFDIKSLVTEAAKGTAGVAIGDMWASEINKDCDTLTKDLLGKGLITPDPGEEGAGSKAAKRFQQWRESEGL